MEELYQFYDDDGRRNISCDDGDSRGDIIFDDGRLGSRYKYTSNFYYINTGETVGGDGIGGYSYQTSHYSSHKPGYHSILLRIPGSSCHVDGIIDKNEGVDTRGDGARRGSKSRETRHSYFNNDG